MTFAELRKGLADLKTQVVTYYVASLVAEGAITEAEAVTLGNLYLVTGLPGRVVA